MFEFLARMEHDFTPSIELIAVTKSFSFLMFNISKIISWWSLFTIFETILYLINLSSSWFVTLLKEIFSKEINKSLDPVLFVNLFKSRSNKAINIEDINEILNANIPLAIPTATTHRDWPK